MWCWPGRRRFASPVCWSWWDIEGFLERGWIPVLIGCVRTPPARLLVYLLPRCLWLYELHSQSTMSRCEYMIVTPSCGDASTRGRYGLSSPVCQDFWNWHRTLYPPVVALPSCPSPSQSAVGEYGWSSTSCGVVSTREVIVVVPAFLEL